MYLPTSSECQPNRSFVLGHILVYLGPFNPFSSCHPRALYQRKNCVVIRTLPMYLTFHDHTSLLFPLGLYKYDPEFHLKNAASFFSVPGPRWEGSISLRRNVDGFLVGRKGVEFNSGLGQVK